jgi:hypothetical protein
MEIILTESQLKKILTEERKKDVQFVLDDSKKFVRKLIIDAKQQFNIDFTFALTWGSVIGGFVGPVSKYLEGTYPNLTHSDIVLLSFGVLLTFFSENKEKLRNVLNLIKEKGLITMFNIALMKSYDLKESFTEFLKSLGVTVTKVSNMMIYCFLIPLIPMIKDIADMSLTSDQMQIIMKSFITYGGAIIGKSVVSEVLKKMVKRFKS